ncbi:hypothetical protein THF5H11_260011 [Vibrio jasicida]|nr:hypothetical protein THF5H11_260011 [Vibrio jasicida]
MSTSPIRSSAYHITAFLYWLLLEAQTITFTIKNNVLTQITNKKTPPQGRLFYSPSLWRHSLTIILNKTIYYRSSASFLPRFELDLLLINILFT